MKYLQNYSAEEACRHITDIAMHGCVFRTEVLKQNDVTITEKCFYTDVEYICKGLAFCKTVCFADNAVYMYRVSVSGQSVSVEGVKKHYKDYLKVVRALIDFYRKTPMEESVAEVLHKRICESIAAYYGCLYIIGTTRRNRERVVAIDKKLKIEYPDFYDSKSRFMNICRKLNFRFFKLCAIYRRKTFAL